MLIELHLEMPAHLYISLRRLIIVLLLLPRCGCPVLLKLIPSDIRAGRISRCLAIITGIVRENLFIRSDAAARGNHHRRDCVVKVDTSGNEVSLRDSTNISNYIELFSTRLRDPTPA